MLFTETWAGRASGISLRNGWERFYPEARTQRVKLLDDTSRSYLFRTRTIPDTDWSVVTFVVENSLGQRFYEAGD